jgi:hypothetical protein
MFGFLDVGFAHEAGVIENIQQITLALLLVAGAMVAAATSSSVAGRVAAAGMGLGSLGHRGEFRQLLGGSQGTRGFSEL